MRGRRREQLGALAAHRQRRARRYERRSADSGSHCPRRAQRRTRLWSFSFSISSWLQHVVNWIGLGVGNIQIDGGHLLGGRFEREGAILSSGACPGEELTGSGTGAATPPLPYEGANGVPGERSCGESAEARGATTITQAPNHPNHFPPGRPATKATPDSGGGAGVAANLKAERESDGDGEDDRRVRRGRSSRSDRSATPCGQRDAVRARRGTRRRKRSGGPSEEGHERAREIGAHTIPYSIARRRRCEAAQARTP